MIAHSTECHCDHEIVIASALPKPNPAMPPSLRVII
jgi:hypothetical protein